MKLSDTMWNHRANFFIDSMLLGRVVQVSFGRQAWSNQP